MSIKNIQCYSTHIKSFHKVILTKKKKIESILSRVFDSEEKYQMRITI